MQTSLPLPNANPADQFLLKLLKKQPELDGLKEFFKLNTQMLQESNLWRYGAIKLNISGPLYYKGSGSAPTYQSITLTNLMPNLRTGQFFYMTPPPSFQAAYPEVVWTSVVTSDGYNIDPAINTVDSTVVLTLINTSVGTTYTIANNAIWTYAGVITPSLNGYNPDGTQIPSGSVGWSG